MTLWLKNLVRQLLGEYEIYQVFAIDRSTFVSPKAHHHFHCTLARVDVIDSSNDELVRQQAWYAGSGANAYVCIEGSRVVGLCIYWHGDRYRTRNFWPLQPNEAKLVQIVTVPDMRGRGVARCLIENSAESMFGSGYQKLYARIWHSNKSSIAAFSAAGWAPAACVVTLNPFRLKQAWRLCFARRQRARQ